jgi:uncharacterized RDD family membrane protein YckC
MKCPKCDYLGFETGDRCRNCGYDFSLLALAEPAADLPLGTEWARAVENVPLLRPLSAADPALRAPAAEELDLPLMTTDPSAASPSPEAAVAITGSVATVPRLRAAPARVERPSGLPLFSGDAARPLEPRVQVPATPRAPVAVRRASEFPRFKSTMPPRATPSGDEVSAFEEPARHDAVSASRPVVVPPPRQHARGAPARQEACGPTPRALAALIDGAILLAIDLVVVYLTLRMAELPIDQWRALPPLPLLAFVSLLAFGYHTAFTAFGGQTIGKMAARIRVVSDDETALRPARVFQRTLTGALSLVTLGLGYVPALVATDGRALHDRLAHTRVVIVPAA